MQMLMPFGKHKGMPLEIVAEDKSYANWLLNRGELRFSNPTIHALLLRALNSSQIAPSETPMHNRMQIRFSNEKNLRLRVIYAYFRSELEKKIDDLARLKEKELPSNFEISTNWKFNFYEKAPFECEDNPLARDVILHGGLIWWVYSNYQFSNFHHYKTSGFENTPYCHGINCEGDIRVEIKPVVGEDWSTVLREMKKRRTRCLFLNHYDGYETSEADFNKLFRSQGITVLYEQEADSLLPFLDSDTATRFT